MKIVINTCYGGFGLSEKATMLYGKKAGLNIIAVPDTKFKSIINYYLNEVHDDNYFVDWDIKRDDPILVEVVEELGAESNGEYAKLKVVEIPDDVVDWRIDEYNGAEYVCEGRRWN